MYKHGKKSKKSSDKEKSKKSSDKQKSESESLSLVDDSELCDDEIFEDKGFCNQIFELLKTNGIMTLFNLSDVINEIQELISKNIEINEDSEINKDSVDTAIKKLLSYDREFQKILTKYLENQQKSTDLEDKDIKLTEYDNINDLLNSYSDYNGFIKSTKDALQHRLKIVEVEDCMEKLHKILDEINKIVTDAHSEMETIRETRNYEKVTKSNYQINLFGDLILKPIGNYKSLKLSCNIDNVEIITIFHEIDKKLHIFYSLKEECRTLYDDFMKKFHEEIERDKRTHGIIESINVVFMHNFLSQFINKEHEDYEVSPEIRPEVYINDNISKILGPEYEKYSFSYVQHAKSDELIHDFYIDIFEKNVDHFDDEVTKCIAHFSIHKEAVYKGFLGDAIHVVVEEDTSLREAVYTEQVSTSVQFCLSQTGFSIGSYRPFSKIPDKENLLFISNKLCDWLTKYSDGMFRGGNLIELFFELYVKLTDNTDGKYCFKYPVNLANGLLKDEILDINIDNSEHKMKSLKIKDLEKILEYINLYIYINKKILNGIDFLKKISLTQTQSKFKNKLEVIQKKDINKYQQKYLKYKAKYLKLKKLMSI